MTKAPSLLNVSDLMSVASHLVEAVFMAAADLGDKGQAEAIQQVCILAKTHLSEAGLILEDVRKGGLL